MSLKPPILHAMSAGTSGGPSSVVTMPTTSWVLFGAITVTRNCSGLSPKEAGSSGPWATICGSTGRPYDLVAVITRKATGWMGASVPGGSTGRWTPFWPPPVRNARRSVKLPNSGPVHRGFGAGRQRFADLRDDDADLARRNLDPRVPQDHVCRPELETDSRHEQFGLPAGFPGERDRDVGRVVPPRGPLADQPAFGRADHDERSRDDVERESSRDYKEGLEQNSHLSCLQRARSLPFMRGCAQTAGD